MRFSPISFRFTRKRVALWLVLLAFCLVMTSLFIKTAHSLVQDVSVVQPCDMTWTPSRAWKRIWNHIDLKPGQQAEQEFLLRGRAGGLWSGIYLDATVDEDYTGSATLQLIEHESGKVLFEEILSADVLKQNHQIPIPKDLEELEHFSFLEHLKLNPVIAFPEEFLESSRTFSLILTNHSQSHSITLGYTPEITPGTLTINNEVIHGFLNYAVDRISDYHPSILFYVAIVAANLTVLCGAGLVLFTDIKTHILYLFLALGFGFVMLFDLTPMYGFDMQYHFDSTYVLSNQMLGLGGPIETPSNVDPEKTTLSYYRRYGDDYTTVSHFYYDYVFMNYTDTYRGLLHFGFDEANRKLVLEESSQGEIGEQLYLYIPQAFAFTLSRLLCLGFYPMLQLARMVNYAVFVSLVFQGIRQLPFGKRLFMLFALTPAVMIQTVSITRDALLIGMCFYLTAKVLTMTYTDEMPSKRDWAVTILLSALLAPCKMVYLPVAFLWLLVIYRKYIVESHIGWKKGIARAALLAIPVFAFFVCVSFGSISNVVSAEKASLDGTVSYSIKELLTDPLLMMSLFYNTFYNSLGTYFVNAIQLFDIRLGSSDGITIVVLILMLLECLSDEPKRYAIRIEERCFLFVVFLGVFFLAVLASAQWTPNTSAVIMGFQGRYLTPILPLLGVCLFDPQLIRIQRSGNLLIDLSYCIFPAIVLMNMYLWTIERIRGLSG